MTADQLIESLRLSGRSDALNGAVENKNLPLHLRNEIEAAQNACMAAVRYLSEKPQAPAEAHGDLLDIVLAQEDANLLRRLIGDGDDAASVRLTIGEGHTGYGLYVSEADYPEEGAVLLHPMTRPDKPQPKGADQLNGWRLSVREDAEQSWLLISGPRGQELGFSAERGSLRAEMLQDLSIDLMAPSPAPAQSAGTPVATDRPFFAYDPENGVEFFKTEQEAHAYAAESLKEYSRAASFDGEWSGDVEAVKVGRVTHVAVERGNDEAGFDYSLEPTVPCAAVGDAS